MAEPTPHGIAPHSPLNDLSLPADARFRLAPAKVRARAVLRGAALAQRLGASLGLALPARLSSTVANDRALLWLGPDEWLLMVGTPDLPAPPAEGEGSVVDVSHRQIGLVADGPLAALVLASGCPLDLRLTAFPVGMVARTIFHKAEIVLWRQTETRFHIEVWRSFAPYVVSQAGEALAAAP
jgi:sarcosine oxidase subunit gamma